MRIALLVILVTGLNFYCEGQDPEQGSALEFSAFNDSWGGGLSPNYDNLRSFGFGLNFKTVGAWQIKMKYSGLTDQFSGDPTRMDELYFRTRIPLIRFREKSDYLGLTLGFYANGKMGGEKIQNVVHDIFGVPALELPYSDDQGIYPAVGYTFVKKLWQNKSIQNRLSLLINLGGEYGLNYKLATLWTVGLQWKSEQGSWASLRLGYRGLHWVRDHPLLDAVYRAESGWNIKFNLGFRYLSYFFDLFPANEFSSGGIRLRIPLSSDDHSTNLPMLAVSLGSLSDAYGLNIKTTYLFSGGVKLLANLQFATYRESKLFDFPKVRGHSNMITGGLEIDLLHYKRNRLVTPYGNLSLGVNTLSIYSMNPTVEENRYVQGAGVSDQGLLFRIPLFFIKPDKNVRLGLFHRFVFLTKMQTPFPYRNDSTLVATFHSKWGISIHLSLD